MLAYHNSVHELVDIVCVNMSVHMFTHTPYYTYTHNLTPTHLINTQTHTLTFTPTHTHTPTHLHTHTHTDRKESRGDSEWMSDHPEKISWNICRLRGYNG